MTLNISSKEMMLLVYALRAFPDNIRNSRVDVCVNSQVMIGAWESQGGKSSLELVRVSKKLFVEVSERNIQSCANEADTPSRRLPHWNARLSRGSFASVESAFAGELGHSFDLMALDSNAMRGKGGMPLPHFPLTQVLSRVV